MSRRFQIVLPDQRAAQLRELAAADGRPPSTLAAVLVLAGLARSADEPAGLPQPCWREAKPRREPRRPEWLEPATATEAWRATSWAAIAALHARYPRALGVLRDGWWQDHSHLELLCALSTWRAAIDASSEDPREELAFHAELAAYGEVLRGEGGGVSRTWQPGPPPAGWARL